MMQQLKIQISEAEINLLNLETKKFELFAIFLFLSFSFILLID